MKNRNIYKDILFGLAIGDALGVPVEFKSRHEIAKDPVTGMIGYGTHQQPAGTFSDDSSMAFCLAEALTRDFDIQAVADNFVKWVREGYWTPWGTVFDIGIATSQAIARLEKGAEPVLAGGMEEGDNGNGSLMRILPLLTYVLGMPTSEKYRLIKDVSSITHGHIRSVIACFYYLEYARLIAEGMEKFEAYERLKNEVPVFLYSISVSLSEVEVFKRLFEGDIYKLERKEIASSGYVLHTLEVSIWCLLKTDNYRDATLLAVNLGMDTDTTGSVTGGLAGLLYGWETIPADWMKALVRKRDIEDLAERMESLKVV